MLKKELHTKHADAASFTALAHYSIPHIVGLGSALGQAAVAGLIAMLLDKMLTAYLQTQALKMAACIQESALRKAQCSAGV